MGLIEEILISGFSNTNISKAELLNIIKKFMKEAYSEEKIKNININPEGALINLKNGEKTFIDIDWQEFIIND